MNTQGTVAAGEPDRVLIVDDSESTSRTLQLILERKGYSTETARTGREALAAIGRQAFAVALLDIRLPDMEGTELLQPLRQAHPDAAMVMLTANASVETAVRALNEGASAYLIKPVNVEEVLAVLRGCIEKQRLVRRNRELHHRAEEARRKLAETTSQLVHNQKLIALGELTAGVAHELNQPLNTLKLTCQAALRYYDPHDPEAVLDDFRHMLEIIDEMAKIIDDMRVFTRRADQLELKLVDLSQVVRSALRFSTGQLKSDGVQVVKDLAEDLPPVRGDAGRLQQVLMNLISNARHAVVATGDRQRRIILRTFEQAAEGAAPRVVCEIEDNGVGIPPNLIQEVFLPFMTTRRPSQGTGLGLSIANKIAEEHRGKLEARSTFGEGALMRLTLPAALEEGSRDS